jgi:hypothetical protein
MKHKPVTPPGLVTISMAPPELPPSAGAPRATAEAPLILPRFRGHQKSHESAVGVFIDGTKAKEV